ncbi:MAG TPA: 30S ribosomal protein S2 [Elusimicrobiales bacterium]|nr:30S ribosomal protein S2 [Elusimicrobiales bacterium]
MLNVSMKTMLEAGVHFGHQTSRWNPKMSRFIFGERNGIHILDLQKTAKEIKKAYTFLKDKAQSGATFLFVGTKKQAQEIVRIEAERAGVPCVHEKWLGGTLTNFSTIRRSVERLNELEKWERDGLFKAISKKEVSRLTKEMTRMKKFLGGIRDLRGTPDVIFIIDPVDNMGAVLEAKNLNIPIVAVCDTNSDPDTVDYPIPGNDDAARSIKLFCAMAADAVLEGRKAAAEASKAQQQPAEAAAAAPEAAAEQVPAPELAPEAQPAE